MTTPTPEQIAGKLTADEIDSLVDGCCASDEKPEPACLCANDYDTLLDKGLVVFSEVPRGIIRTPLGLAVRAHLTKDIRP